MNARHTEFFGPDLGRGPFSSQRIETSALQIATALAQLRAPLGRGADELRTHADFIRELADRLAPDYASQLALDVTGSVPSITVTIRTAVGTYSLLDCWLADTVGGGLTGTAPSGLTFSLGVIIQTVVSLKHYRVLAPTGGVVNMTVSYGSPRTWYAAVSRGGRVYYSSALHFEAP